MLYDEICRPSYPLMITSPCNTCGDLQIIIMAGCSTPVHSALMNVLKISTICTIIGDNMCFFPHLFNFLPFLYNKDICRGSLVPFLYLTPDSNLMSKGASSLEMTNLHKVKLVLLSVTQ